MPTGSQAHISQWIFEWQGDNLLWTLHSSSRAYISFLFQNAKLLIGLTNSKNDVGTLSVHFAALFFFWNCGSDNRIKGPTFKCRPNGLRVDLLCCANRRCHGQGRSLKPQTPHCSVLWEEVQGSYSLHGLDTPFWMQACVAFPLLIIPL